MLDRISSAFHSYPNYDSELQNLYKLRKKKYTLSKPEIEYLKILLLPKFKVVQNNVVTNSQSYAFDTVDDDFIPNQQYGYYQLMKKIQDQIEHIADINKGIKSPWYNKFLPDFIVKIDDTNLRIALAFVRYHHGCFISLENPDLAFNVSHGLESLEKAFEFRDKRFNFNKFRSSKLRYTAKNMMGFLKAKSSSFMKSSFIIGKVEETTKDSLDNSIKVYTRENFTSKKLLSFGDDPIRGLQKAFERKIVSTKKEIHKLEIVQNKKRIRQDVAANACSICDISYKKQEDGFIAFLTRLFAKPKPNTVKAPVGNLLMQEIKDKLASPETKDTDKMKIKAMAKFTKSVPASHKLSDYSVIDSDSNKENMSIHRYDILVADNKQLRSENIPKNFKHLITKTQFELKK